MTATPLKSRLLTFLLSDIEGSTRQWERDEQAMRAALARHDQVMSTVIGDHGGAVVKHTGDGVLAVFEEARAALAATVAAQKALGADNIADAELRVRIALHAGFAEERNGDYFGPALNRCARLLAAGHGGQILLTKAACMAVSPATVELRNLGDHGLKDLRGVETIFQAVVPGLRSSFPRLKAGNTTPHNLPESAAAFIGRNAEIDAARRLLHRHRLVTLTGTGGVGKTRLVIELGFGELATFTDAVVFVDLSRLADPGLVATAILDQLVAVVERGTVLPAKTPVETLCGYLRTKAACLIIDNCEPVLDAAAEVIDTLLSSCPGLKILATSREPLAVPGEQVLPLAPFAVLENSGTIGEAVQLFLDRARAAAADLVFDDRDRTLAEDICRRLDGLPLAIELAASHASHLSIAQILEQLESGFEFLGATRSRRGTRSLADTIGWSVSRLDPTAVGLLSELSIFAGHFTLALAERVCEKQAEPLPLVIGRLAAQSLLWVDRSQGMPSTYRMLSPIRAYAAATATAEARTRLRSRHRDGYLDWVESYPLVDQCVGSAMADAVEIQIDDLRMALASAMQDGRLDIVSRLASGAGCVWWVRQHQSEGREWLALAAAADDEIGIEARVRRLIAAGTAAMVDQDWLAVHANLSAAVPLVEREPRCPSGPFVYGYLAVLQMANPAEGLLLLAKARALEPSVLEPWLPLLAHAEGDVQLADNDIEAAIKSYSAALRDYDERRFAWWAISAYASLAVAYHLAGADTDAATVGQRSVALAEQYPTAFASVGREVALALPMAKLGNVATAAALIRRALEKATSRSDGSVFPGEPLFGAAALAMLAGDIETAATLVAALRATGGHIRSPWQLALWRAYSRRIAEQARRPSEPERALTLDEAIAVGDAFLARIDSTQASA